MDASTDPTVGTSQSATVFWAKAKKNMDALSPNGNCGRSIESVTRVFKEIQKHVNLFTGFFSKVSDCFFVYYS
jgi:hypothetical protein